MGWLRKSGAAVFRHFWWRVFSLVLATLLWLAIVDEPDMTTTLSVPVEYKNVPRELDISTDVPERVMLQLRGPRDKITDAASGARLAVVLDLGDRRRGERDQPGERTYTIEPGNVQLPPTVALVRSVPSQLRLTLEPRVRKDVPVAMRFVGPVPEGYRLVSTKIIPETIQVVGPESRVRQVDKVETDPLNLAALQRSAGRETEVMLNTFIADEHVSPSAGAVVRVRVLLEKLP